MSRAEQRTDQISATREYVFARDQWRCVHRDSQGRRCPEPATQLAHVLPQDRVHLNRYGARIIHHPDNLRSTCPAHNASVQINYRSQPRLADEHAAEIHLHIAQEAQQ